MCLDLSTALSCSVIAVSHFMDEHNQIDKHNQTPDQLQHVSAPYTLAQELDQTGSLSEASAESRRCPKPRRVGVGAPPARGLLGRDAASHLPFQGHQVFAPAVPAPDTTA